MNQVKAGAILNYVIIGLNALVGLVYTPFMLRCLGQNEYGLYSLVASIIAYLTLLDFGFGPTVVRYTAKYIAEGKEKEQSALYGLFFFLYSVIGLLALGIGFAVYANLDGLFDKTMSQADLSQARTMILLLLVNLAVTFPMSVFGSIVTAYERFIFQKMMIIARILLSTAVMIGILLLGYKAVAMVICQTVFNLLLLASNYLYCKHKLHVKLRFEKCDRSFIRELLGFSIWMFIGDIMFKFYYSTGSFVLGATSGTTAVAVFALGVTLLQMYILFSGGISGVLLPRITSMVTKHSSDREISDLFVRVGRLQFLILGLILGGFVVFGRNFIRLWADEGYEEVYYIAILFFSSTLIPLIQNTGIVILQARNRLRYRAVMLLTVSAASLVAQVILAKYYGAIGCAVAIAAGNLIGQGVIMNWYYAKKQNIDMICFWKEIGKMSVVPVALSLAGLLLYENFCRPDFGSMVAWGSVYIALYGVLSWTISLNATEKTMLAAPLSRLLHKHTS